MFAKRLAARPFLTPRRRLVHHPFRPCLERLEECVMPSVYTVTSVADSGPGTLRQMLLDANQHPGFDTIDFNIRPSGAHTIHLLSALPLITDPVLIDGTSEPQFAGSPLIQLDGARAGSGVPGLYVWAPVAPSKDWLSAISAAPGLCSCPITA
jgi:hypothetical protein